MFQLVLASESSRRRELLEKAGYEFETIPAKLSEILEENLTPDEAILKIAGQKAGTVAKLIKTTDKFSKDKRILVLAADTVVFLEQLALGKPRDQAEAVDFLRRLSGRTHVVKTAIFLQDLSTDKTVHEVSTTFVNFQKLSDVQISEYVSSKKPFDKAGAYGIQELPPGFLAGISGDHDNVVGLPMSLLEKLLAQNGWTILKRR